MLVALLSVGASAQSTRLTLRVPYSIHQIPDEYRSMRIECTIYNMSGQAIGGGSQMTPTIPVGGDSGTRSMMVPIDIRGDLDPRVVPMRYVCELLPPAGMRPPPVDGARSRLRVEGSVTG